MATLKVTTNLPAATVKVVDGRSQVIAKKTGDYNVSSKKPTEIIIENLKSGYYIVNLELPYFDLDIHAKPTQFERPIGHLYELNVTSKLVLIEDDNETKELSCTLEFK